MLVVIPNFLAKQKSENVFPASNKKYVASIKHFAIETPKETRAFLKTLLKEPDYNKLHFYNLGKRSEQEDWLSCTMALKNGETVGLISDAGMPGIADPGKDLVGFAHQNNIKVKVLIGPSSIFLALAGSGLNGQCFSFHGYLPREQTDLSKKLRLLEKESHNNNMTQIFIETPYRNNAIFAQLKKTLSSDTLLCIAANLTSESEYIKTMSIAEWEKENPALNKIPCVFLFLKY